MRNDSQQLALLVKEKLGIDLTENEESLLRKLSPRLEALQMGVWAYIHYIKTNPTEWDYIIDCVTINETYFFREVEQLEAFRTFVENWDKPTLRIWSAACSTGEEPYSLAMIAKEHAKEGTEIEIAATDINEDVLQVAKKGTYPKHSLSFRRLDEATRSRYFEESETDYHVRKMYQSCVHFSRFNLVDEAGWLFKKNFDIIFCRNVLIYFDEDTTKTIITHFYDSLAETGYLFLGHSDPYRQIHPSFQLIRTPETLYLKKGETK